jgi:mannan endo-1,4-beta-mannosidase
MDLYCMRTWLSLVLFLFNSQLLAQTTLNGQIKVSSIFQTNNPRTRQFTYRLPASPVACNRPLLIALHGDGGSGSGMMAYTGFNLLADSLNFIAVYPSAQNTLWGVQWNKYADATAGYAGIPDPNAADDVQFISDLIDYFYASYGIDRSKVYVTGHSGGGFMAYHLAIANTTKNKIAAIAPVAASLWGENAFLNTQFNTSAYVQTAVLHLHSPSDAVVAFPTLNSWTWPLASFSNRNCNNAAYATTAITATIDKHTFCGPGHKVILMGLKKASLGHGWPTLANADYNGSLEIMKFFEDFSKGSYPPPSSSFTLTSTNLGNYTSNQVIKAQDSIYTSAPPNININASNSERLSLQAGKSISLNPGIEIQQGAVFTAKIEACKYANPTMKVQQGKLYDADNQEFILRGVNYSVMDDWGFPAVDLISEIEKSGSNAVRLQWYKTYHTPSRPAYTDSDLDALLLKCKTNKMVPILELHDLTCVADANLLNSQLIPWWTNPSRVNILNKHKKYLIINLANELGQYRWQSYSATALNNWKNAYKTAISAIRAAGLEMPIMIDAPDCGTDLKAITDAGQEIINHDPLQNIIFSVHAYWANYNGTADLTTAVNANLPLVFGEIANKQDDYLNGSTSFCHYNLDGTSDPPNNPTNGFQYQNLLNTLKTQNIGWLAWAWVRDGCTYRNMTENNTSMPYGQFNSLSVFGNDIVNNVNYGLKNAAIRTAAF